MRKLTPEELLLLERAKIIERAQQTDLWPLLRDFCREVAEQSVSMGFVQPQNATLYVGSANVALDIFRRLNEIPAQAAELQRQIVEEQETSARGSDSPKPSRRHQPVSHI